MEDRYAVAVHRGNTIVGHLPRKISTMCSLFIRRGGSISCTVSILTAVAKTFVFVDKTTKTMKNFLSLDFP